LLSLQVKILDAVPEQGKLVVSQRLALSASTPALQRGTVVSATVTGLRPYGAFVEVDGGHSGLLHISQVSAERVDDLAALFSVGDKLRVVVLDHDRATGRVALGTKQLEARAGDMLRDRQSCFSNAEDTLKK
jgi:small subunit ribosomal protein S1